MPQLPPTSLLATSPISPSFNTYYTSFSSSSSDDETLADIAARVVQELSGDSSACEFYSWEEEEEEESADFEKEEKEIIQRKKNEPNRDEFSLSSSGNDDAEEGEFEFAIAGRETATSPISADEIFYNGQIRPLYPLFNTDLLLNGPDFQSLKSGSERNRSPLAAAAKPRASRRAPLMKLFKEEEREKREDDSPPSSSEDLDSVPEGTYCVWNPRKEQVESSPEICKKKSNSDGGDSKRWKLFRDMIYRSNSDGNCKNRNDERRRRGREKELKAEEDGAEKVVDVKESEKRQSFLPYREDLVGVLSNVSGVSRNLHPF